MSRYLCSELVVLKSEDAETVVNLEEIWVEGAAVEADEAVGAGLAVELRCGENRFAGTVISAEEHEFGWRMELEFSPGTQWRPEVYKPGHLVNPADLPGEKGAGAG